MKMGMRLQKNRMVLKQRSEEKRIQVEKYKR